MRGYLPNLLNSSEEEMSLSLLCFQNLLSGLSLMEMSLSKFLNQFTQSKVRQYTLEVKTECRYHCDLLIILFSDLQIMVLKLTEFLVSHQVPLLFLDMVFQ